MSANKIINLTTTDAKETEELGKRLGALLKGGEVIELSSDLGGGKTTFIRGVAKGIGSQEVVASPTFTLSRVYKGDGLELHHFDFYRLGEAGLSSYELSEAIGEPGVVVAIEWGEVVENVLPGSRVVITIQNRGNNTRSLKFSLPPRLAYLEPEL